MRSMQSRADTSGIVQRLQAIQAQTERGTYPRNTGVHGHRHGPSAPLEKIRDEVSSLSGQDISDVKIHQKSPLPAQKGALALATAREVHLGPGQEHAAGHEFWHVAQQRAGRVRATQFLSDGTRINQDSTLEREADLMGYRAQLRASRGPKGEPQSKTIHPAPSLASPPIVQGLWNRSQAQAKVSVRGSFRSEEYHAILNEFGLWAALTTGRSAAVKYEYLIRLKDRIDEYIESKRTKAQSTARDQRIENMGLLLDNVEQEIIEVRRGETEPPEEMVYVGGGKEARSADTSISGGLSFGIMNGKRAIDPGIEDSLRGLDEGSVIHVYGHSNFGTGIGSKKHKLTPSALVDSLISDGLRPGRAVTIRLAACGTGASIVSGGKIVANSKPFVEQVAKLLAGRGFQNATVVGYTAFVIPARYEEAPEGKGRIVYAPDEDIHSKPENQVRLRDREVIWTIREGVARKNSGGKFEYSNPRKGYFKIHSV